MLAESPSCEILHNSRVHCRCIFFIELITPLTSGKMLLPLTSNPFLCVCQLSRACCVATSVDLHLFLACRWGLSMAAAACGTLITCTSSAKLIKFKLDDDKLRFIFAFYRLLHSPAWLCAVNRDCCF